MRCRFLACSFALVLALPACETVYGPVVRDIRPLGGGKIAVDSCYLRGEAFSGRARVGFASCSERVVDVNAPAPAPAASAASRDRTWED